MPRKAPDEVLFDSETTLRLVDQAIREFRSEDPSAPAAAGAPAAELSLTALPRVLLRAYTEIISVLERLRQSRSALERVSVERLHHTQERLREVSSATETAATSILDGLDRALALVDRLDEGAHAAAGTQSAAARQSLRDELFTLMHHLQFQDITAQQLSYASSVLVDMEQRLDQILEIFNPHVGAGVPGIDPAVPTEPTAPAAAPRVGAAAFDPAATNHGAEQRQALADEIFMVVGDRK